MDLFPPNEQSPYDTLIELVRFAEVADKHITAMNENQKVLIEQHNLLKTRVDHLEMRLRAWEAVASAMAEDVDASK